MQKLHRGAAAVAVGRSVDRCHPADAQQNVEVPLVSEHAAYALLSPHDERIEEHVSGVGVGYYGVHALSYPRLAEWLRR
jgi:hypothetical protein